MACGHWMWEQMKYVTAIKGRKDFEWSFSLSESTKLANVSQDAEIEAASMATTPPSSISKAHSDQHKREKP